MCEFINNFKALSECMLLNVVGLSLEGREGTGSEIGTV